MRRPIRIAIPLGALAAAAAAATALAAVVPIYSNDMSSVAARAQLVKLGRGTCKRGGGQTLKLTVGERTRECDLRTPVIGANLDIKATARLSAHTPTPLQAKVFVGVAVRSGDGGQYQLVVFPGKGSFQLRRDMPPNGDRTLLAKGNSGAVNGVGKANKLRLQAFSSATGDTRVVGFVNGRKLASAVDDPRAAASLTGRYSTLAVGATKAANGAAASFDGLTVSVPDPF
jgi:hypothetical protein